MGPGAGPVGRRLDDQPVRIGASDRSGGSTGTHVARRRLDRGADRRRACRRRRLALLAARGRRRWPIRRLRAHRDNRRRDPVVESTRYGAPMTLVRGGEDLDLPAIVAMGEVRARRSRFHLVRDVDFLKAALIRRRLLAGLAPAGQRELRFLVAEEGITAAAYVILTTTPGSWTSRIAAPRRFGRARRGPPPGHHRQGAGRAAASNPRLAAAGLRSAAAHAAPLAGVAGPLRAGPVCALASPDRRPGSLLAHRPRRLTLFTTGQGEPCGVLYAGRTMAKDTLRRARATRLLRGVDGLADAVRGTLGPQGRNVILGRPVRFAHHHKDGVSWRARSRYAIHSKPRRADGQGSRSKPPTCAATAATPATMWPGDLPRRRPQRRRRASRPISSGASTRRSPPRGRTPDTIEAGQRRHDRPGRHHLGQKHDEAIAA